MTQPWHPQCAATHSSAAYMEPPDPDTGLAVAMQLPTRSLRGLGDPMQAFDAGRHPQVGTRGPRSVAPCAFRVTHSPR